MDFRKLIRDAEKVKDVLREFPDGRLVCKKQVKIYIPTRFEECNLAFIGAETNIIGIYAIVVDDLYYGVSLVNAMMRIEPTSIMKVEIDGVWHYEFLFDAGSTVISDVKLVKNDTLVYYIYNEIVSKGHVPLYVNYMDLGKLFDTAKYHAGADVGNNREVSELLISLIARDSKNRHTYYRQSVSEISDLINNPPAYISLKSVIYAATNTVNKLAGSYFSDAVVSALVSPSSETARIETILRR
jgi:hypothetical protein